MKISTREIPTDLTIEQIIYINAGGAAIYARMVDIDSIPKIEISILEPEYSQPLAKRVFVLMNNNLIPERVNYLASVQHEDQVYYVFIEK